MKQAHRWLTLPQLWPWKQNSFQAYLPLPFSVTECTYVVFCEIIISLGHHLSSPKFWKFFLCKINRVMKYSSCLYLACLKSRMNYSIYYKSTVFTLLGGFFAATESSATDLWSDLRHLPSPRLLLFKEREISNLSCRGHPDPGCTLQIAL